VGSEMCIRDRPEIDSITFSMDIAAETRGTVKGHVVHGAYVQSAAPYVLPER